MESLQASRVECDCGGIGFLGLNQPINFIPSQVQWCTCEAGERAKRHWVDEASKKQSKQLARLFIDSGIPLEYEEATIDGLEHLGDPDKQAAIIAARTLVEDGAIGDKRSLCIIGSYGTGKTTLLSAVLREYLGRGESCLWIALAELFREVQRSYSQGSDEADKKIDAACQAGVLLIDDFGKANLSGPETEDKVRIVDTIINYRHNQRLVTLITSNLTPTEWREQFGQRTSDRVFHMCAVVAMGGQNLRMI